MSSLEFEFDFDLVLGFGFNFIQWFRYLWLGLVAIISAYEKSLRLNDYCGLICLILGLILNLVLSSVFVELGAFGHCDECVQDAGAADGLSLQKHRSDLSIFNVCSRFMLGVGAFGDHLQYTWCSEFCFFCFGFWFDLC